jgi:hypothetical protein
MTEKWGRINFFLIIFRQLLNKKGENFFSPFLPQIYHKLNLLMLWSHKYKGNRMLITNNLDELHQKSLKGNKC